MRILQLTNNAIGAVATNTLMPLGTITRKYCCGNSGRNTFAVSTSGANTITLNDTGYYRISYVGSLTAGAGLVSLNLLVNGAVVTTSSETATADSTENIAIDYIVRVLPSCCSVANSPVTIQVQNATGSVALTGGTSNIIVEKL